MSENGGYHSCALFAACLIVSLSSNKTIRRKYKSSRDYRLSVNLLASAILDVDDRLVKGDRLAETRGARRLVADVEVDGAGLIDTPLAERVLDVEQLQVLADPAVGAHAGGSEVHAVGCGEGQVAVIEEMLALAGRDELI